MERRDNEPAVIRESSFSIDLRPRADAALAARLGALSVQIGQHVRLGSRQEIWKSLSVVCEEAPDGTLIVRVLVFNPDWERGLQIAELRSWPHDGSGMTPLGCNLDHVGL